MSKNTQECNENKDEENEKESIKVKIERYWKKFFPSIEIALLIVGGIISYLGIMQGYSYRSTIGAFMISMWYMLIPTQDMEKKGVNLIFFGCNFLISAVVIWIIVQSVQYFYFEADSKMVKDIFFCLLDVLAISYLAYMLNKIIKYFLQIIHNIHDKLFKPVKEGTSTLKKIIEYVTTFIAAVTALGTSIVSLAVVAKNVIEIFQ